MSVQEEAKAWLSHAARIEAKNIFENTENTLYAVGMMGNCTYNLSKPGVLKLFSPPTPKIMVPETGDPRRP